ncbi:MAG: RNA polymerase factor sigma-54 [Pseudomonadota bacterium]
MGGSVGLKPSQRQSLALTSDLVQALKLLGASSAELEDFIKERVEENPFLDRVEGMPIAPAPDPTGPLTTAAARQGEPQTSGGIGQFAADPVAQIGDERVSLFEQLAAQIRLDLADPTDQAIATEIVLSLDEVGFLRRPVPNLAADLGVTEARVLSVLERVQRFEPVGIAARSLAECFERQLEERGLLSPAMAVLLANLDMLAKGHTKALMRACDVGHANLVTMVKVLRGLDPRPGHRFNADPVPLAVPDIVLEPGIGGAWNVVLNPAALPRVLVNRSYHAQVLGSLSDTGEKRFVVDCLSRANWLVRSLDQRARTILRVATEIVRRQSAFFAHGPAELRPLSRTEVADTLGIHESTVGRAVANKYMLCSHGVIELGYFFPAAISGTDGETRLAAEAVRHRLSELISGETAQSVLSDDDLADLVRAEGMHVARRTIAKYREAMNIPSSAKRRRHLRADALAV